MSHPFVSFPRRILVAAALTFVTVPSAAVAGPAFTEAASWNQPVATTPGGWWLPEDGGNTIRGKANADYPLGAYLQTGYCNPFGPNTQLIGASVRRVRWHANANDMFAYLRFIAPSGETGITGGATSLLTTRRYLYGYQPEGVNLELAASNVVDDHYAFSPGQCVAGGVFFNGPGSNGVLDSPGWTPLVTNMLLDVTVEDLQGPAVANATTWGTWITGDAAPLEWDTSDNAYRRGSTGARVAGGGTVDLGNTGDGHLGAWVPVGSLPDGPQQVCAYRNAPGWGEAAPSCAVFRLDRNNPAPPTVALSPDTSGAWTNADVTVETQPTADGTGSGWDRNQFSVNGGAWVDSPASFTLATEGTYSIAARAVDKAGRVSAASAARVVRIDKSPPVIAGAAVAGATGVLSWSMSDVNGFGACPTTVEMVGPGTAGALVKVFDQASGTLPASGSSVQLPIGALPNGDYQVRLSVCDAAGNTTSDTLGFAWTGNPDGEATGSQPAFVIAAPAASPGAGSRIAEGVAVPVVRSVYGRPFTLRGRLQRRDGSVMAGVPVELRDSAGRYAAGARTDTAGNFAVGATATVGGLWSVAPVGAKSRQPAVWLEVRPTVALRVQMHRAGRLLVATGGLAPSAGVGGKLVQLQWFDTGTRRWRPAVNTHLGPDGRFRITYRFQRAGRYTVAVRIAVPPDAGWPYLAAYSRRVPIRVG